MHIPPSTGYHPRCLLYPTICACEKLLLPASGQRRIQKRDHGRKAGGGDLSRSVHNEVDNTGQVVIRDEERTLQRWTSVSPSTGQVASVTFSSLNLPFYFL